MAISSISSSAGNYQPSQQSNFRQTFGQLVQAVQSGELTGAQQAYAALTKLQSQGKGPDPNSPLGQALTQIGQALQGGSTAGAQQVLQSLAQQTQQAQGGHHHHHHHGGNNAGSNAGSNASGNSGNAQGAIVDTIQLSASLNETTSSATGPNGNSTTTAGKLTLSFSASEQITGPNGNSLTIGISGQATANFVNITA